MTGAGSAPADDGPPQARRRLTVAIAAAVAVLLVGFVVSLGTRAPAQDRVADSVLLGHPAPPLAGPVLGGGDYDIAAQRGQWVLVNFFATWCVPCRREHPELVRWEDEHRRRGDAQLVTVAFSDEPDAVRAFFDEEGGDWPVLAGDDGTIGLDWGVAGVPESFLVDPSGVVRARVVGGVTADGLDRLLAGGPPT